MIWTDHLANPAPVDRREDLPPPEHEEAARERGGDSRRSLREEDAISLHGPKVVGYIQCVSCFTKYPRRDGGLWAGCMCLDCEGDLNLIEVMGGEDE